MIILGAGLSGLICGAMNPGSTIYEAKSTLPDSHKAVLRLRTDGLNKMLGIPLKEVKVQKAIWLHGEEVAPTPRITNMYSQKVLGRVQSRSIMTLTTETRYIPPADLAERLEKKCHIEFSKQVTQIGKGAIVINETEIIPVSHTPVISTLAMPFLLRILNQETDMLLRATSVHTYTSTISDCDTYCTVYFPEPDVPIYRASITGDTLTLEGMEELTSKCFQMAIDALGLNNSDFTAREEGVQHAGKIAATDNKKREELIYQFTQEFGVYSLGRYATWRPKVMIDDLIRDVIVIRSLIEDGNYARAKYVQESE